MKTLMQLAAVRASTVRMVRHDRGAAMVEYALLVALIAIVAIVAMRAVGEQLSDNFDLVDSTIEAN